MTECKHIFKIFLEPGSHLLSNASWGCKDGVHKSWFISDFESKEHALKVVPSFLRNNANIVELTKFDKSDMVNFAEDH
ncbi:MAG: hypothetical protein Q8891_15485 [Bacteroidota bacterium]|nr:hypothetical protein [Bacteroidota bacterium]